MANTDILNIKTCISQDADNKFQTVFKKLKKNNFNPQIVTSKKDAVEYIKNIILPNISVFVAGTMSVFEIGLYEYLLGRKDIDFLNTYQDGISLKTRTDLRRQALLCDFFITSTNAITLEGELINIDGSCNRTAGMLFGPPKVIIIAGRNTITTNRQSAIDRIKNFAAPKNALRLKLETPCTKTGKCENCEHESRICSALLIQSKEKTQNRTSTILVNDDIGF